MTIKSQKYGLVTPGESGLGYIIGLETLDRPTYQVELLTIRLDSDDPIIFGDIPWPYTLIYVFGYSITIYLTKELKREIHDRGGHLFHSNSGTYKIQFQKDRNYIICSVHYSGDFVFETLDDSVLPVCSDWERQSPVFYYSRSKATTRETMDMISMLMLPKAPELRDGFVRDELTRALLKDFLIENDASFQPAHLSGRHLEIFYVERDRLVNHVLDAYSISALLHLAGIKDAPVFRKRLRQLYDLNIRGFVTEIRMAAALKLLDNPTLSIKEIADKSGFSNAFYFSRVFTKYFGLSPKYFRDKLGR